MPTIIDPLHDDRLRDDCYGSGRGRPLAGPFLRLGGVPLSGTVDGINTLYFYRFPSGFRPILSSLFRLR
jgi:hypothetical protein